jgi:hypothetical protein
MWLLGAGLLLLGCGKKATPESAGAEVSVATGGFVDLSLMDDEDDDDFFGSELLSSMGQCGDLIKLEPSAMMGGLTDGEVRCLEDALRDAERQTVKDKISRVLMHDSWAKGDKHRWESIVRRHLQEIDQSDPDLCFSFANYTSKRGPEYFDETMRWIDIAMENRTVWEGDYFVKRVYSLHKLKVKTAISKWEWLENEYLTRATTELNEARRDARNYAKTNAREWLEYAHSAGQDPTLAQQLCVSAAGGEDFCQVK